VVERLRRQSRAIVEEWLARRVSFALVITNSVSVSKTGNLKPAFNWSEHRSAVYHHRNID